MSLVENHLKIIIKLCTAHLFLVQTLGNKWREPPKTSTFPIRIYYEPLSGGTCESRSSRRLDGGSGNCPIRSFSFYSAGKNRFLLLLLPSRLSLMEPLWGPLSALWPLEPPVCASLSQVHGLWLILLQISPFFRARRGGDFLSFFANNPQPRVLFHHKA